MNRFPELYEIGVEWAGILNTGHTPKDISTITKGLTPLEAIHLCQTVVSHSKNHDYASVALTVILNMTRYGDEP